MKSLKKINYFFFSNFFSFIYCLFFSLFFILKSTIAGSVLDLKEDDFILGNEDAPITIIEYASLSCSHCANFHKNTLPKIIEEYIDTGKAKIVFRDYPLNLPALTGSMLIQCVPNHVRYEYLSALFLLQSDWVNPDFEIVKKELFKIMQTGGMNNKEFEDCLNDKKLEEKILQNIIEAQNEFNIRTTPTFLINGSLVEGNKSFSKLKKILDEILLSFE